MADIRRPSARAGGQGGSAAPRGSVRAPQAQAQPAPRISARYARPAAPQPVEPEIAEGELLDEEPLAEEVIVIEEEPAPEIIPARPRPSVRAPAAAPVPQAQPQARVLPRASALAAAQPQPVVQPPQAGRPSQPRSSSRVVLPPAPPPSSARISQRSRSAEVLPVTPSSARNSTRSSSAVSARTIGANQKKAQMKALLVAVGVVVLLGVVALVVWVVRSREFNTARGKIEAQERIKASNFKTAQDVFETATNVGLLFCKQGDDLPQEKIEAAFRGNDKIYNVIYERSYKDKRSNSKSEQKALYKERLVPIKTVASVSSTLTDKNTEVTYTYAFVDGAPLVQGVKSIKSKDGDTANFGGTVKVITKAEMDEIFENAISGKKVKEGAEKK